MQNPFPKFKKEPENFPRTVLGLEGTSKEENRKFPPREIVL